MTWYLFNKDNKCYGTTNIEPDKDDLENSDCKAIKSDVHYDNFSKLSFSGSGITEHKLTTEDNRQKNLSTLDAVYQPQFVALAQALGLASLDANQTVIDGVKADYAALKAEYQAKIKEIG